MVNRTAWRPAHVATAVRTRGSSRGRRGISLEHCLLFEKGVEWSVGGYRVRLAYLVHSSCCRPVIHGGDRARVSRLVSPRTSGTPCCLETRWRVRRRVVRRWWCCCLMRGPPYCRLAPLLCLPSNHKATPPPSPCSRSRREGRVVMWRCRLSHKAWVVMWLGHLTCKAQGVDPTPSLSVRERGWVNGVEDVGIHIPGSPATLLRCSLPFLRLPSLSPVGFALASPAAVVACRWFDRGGRWSASSWRRCTYVCAGGVCNADEAEGGRGEGGRDRGGRKGR